MEDNSPNISLIKELNLDPRIIFGDGNIHSSHPEELLQSGIPSSLECTIEDIRNFGEGDDFASDRKDYIEQFRIIIHTLFDEFAPKAGLKVMEVGPGPKAYSLTRKILPLESISSLTMLELSEEYYKKARKKARFKSNKGFDIEIINDDIHTHKLRDYRQGYDVIFCSSSLDSSGYVDKAIQNISTLLKDKESVAIITQDVYPDIYSILALASQRSINDKDRKITYSFDGPNDGANPVMWIEENGIRYSSSSYLMRELAEYARDEGLDIKEIGRWGGSIIVSPENRQKFGMTKRLFAEKRANGHNTLTTYMDKHIASNNSKLKKGCLEVRYYSDVLVIGK